MMLENEKDMLIKKLKNIIKEKDIVIEYYINKLKNYENKKDTQKDEPTCHNVY